MVLNKLKTAIQTAQDFGFKWTSKRLYYELQLRSGYHKRYLPKRQWKENELANVLQEGISPENVFEQWQKSDPQFLFSIQDKSELAKSIQEVYKNHPKLLKGLNNLDIKHLRYFTHLNYEVKYPDVWFTNPFLDPPVKCTPDLHWSEYPMAHPEYEDFKFIWEPGRFSIVYDMVRSFVLTDDPTLPEQYWTLIESWIDNNPPNTGPHWKCGQEISLRLMAWYFGLFAFKDSPATTPERFAKFLTAVAAQMDRVSKDLSYSYLQHSNHAVSEGLGLYVTGLLFPQFKKAAEWKKMGKDALEERITFLVRADGTYYQKSHNYLRFILQAYLYVLPLAEKNGDIFSDQVKTRLTKALDYLKSVFDPKSGKVPNYGSNDGALILPLNSCDFTDFTSVIGAMHFYLNKEKCFENGPWNEDLVWLFGKEALDENKYRYKELAQQNSAKYEDNGIYVLRNEKSAVFLHAESFKDRPAHADALHVDLWWKGLNIAIDPGTYLYYGHQPWFDAYRHTKFHNTICVDGRDQMDRAFRFTWGNWHKCQLNQWEPSGENLSLELEQDGYKRLEDPVIHRRAIINIEKEYWLVIDDLIGKAKHDFSLHWLINDFPFQQEKNIITLETANGPYAISIQNLDEKNKGIPVVTKGNPRNGIEGLKSNYYGRIEPAISMRLQQKEKFPLRLVSCFGPAGWKMESDQEQSSIQFTTANNTTSISMNKIGSPNIIQDKVFSPIKKQK